MNKMPAGLLRALQTLYSERPVTDLDRQEHKRLVTRQIARDEAKTAGQSPQTQIQFREVA